MDRVSHSIGAWVEQSVSSIIIPLSYIPGAPYLGRYIQASHQNDPARTIFELLLFLFAVRYFLASKEPYNKSSIKLSDDEIDALVSEWEPESLVGPLDDTVKEMLHEIPTIVGPNGPVVRVRGHDKPLVNLTSYDFYNFGHNPEIKQVGKDGIRLYGVGSCGPAGFYGNEKAHIDLEKVISDFLGTEGTILYAQALATASSVIPCFAKKSDILVVDSLVNMSVQKGIQLSRARVFYYHHNDMEDLERQLIAANKSYRKGPVPRRHIITEGLFEYTGKSPDLKRIVELKNKYKYRLVLDESWSLGVLGATGRGLPEEQGVPRSDVDITIGSLVNAVGSGGGFCSGLKHMVEHQRIVSLAYTFSATCPPYLALDAAATLGIMSTPAFHTSQLRHLADISTVFYDALSKSRKIEIVSRRGVPVVIFQLTGSPEPAEADAILSQIVLAARDKNLLISRLRRIAEFEVYPHIHAIKLFIPSALSTDEAKAHAKTMVAVIDKTVRR